MDDLLYLYLLKLFHKNAHSFMGFKLLIVPAIQLLAFPFCFISNSLCNVHPLVFFFLGGCFFHVCFVLYRSHLRFCDNGLLMLQFLMWTSVATILAFFFNRYSCINLVVFGESSEISSWCVNFQAFYEAETNERD